MKGEFFVDTAQAGDEMVFEGSDGAFGSIAAMDARWGELEVDRLVPQELLEGDGAFVVEALELGAKAGSAEALVEGLEASEDGRGMAARDGFSKDAIAVVVVDDNQVVIAIARWCNKASGLVGVDLAGRFQDGGEAVV